MNKQMRTIYSLCKNKQFILIDCFDTIIYRSCEPQLVIERWLISLAEEYDIELAEVNKIWSALRKAKSIDRNEIEEIPFRQLCLEFFRRLTYIKEISSSFQFFYDKALRKMISIEKSVIASDSDIVNLIKRLHFEGKYVCCVSDFYLPKECLQELFESLEIADFIDDIYVSSDVGKRKSSGTLYKYVLEKLACSETDVIMLGDNKHSDYKLPRSLGMKAICYKSKCAKKAENVSSVYTFLQSLSQENEKKELPFADYGFSLYLFCNRLYKRLMKKDFKKVYFFSREGEFLKKAFDMYLELKGEAQLATEYLYISRQSTFLPSLKSIQSEKFEGLKKQYTCLSIEDFLKSINLWEIVSQLIELKDKYDFHCKIDNFFSSESFSLFCNEEAFREVYEEARVRAKKEALMYFETCGISKNTKKIAIVDIGWKGSIQDNLYQLLGEECEIAGYYYGLLGNVKLHQNCKKYGLVFSDLPYKSEAFDIFKISYRMLERVLYASHGSCVQYKNAIPVLDKASCDEQELYKLVEPIQNRMLVMLESIYNFSLRNSISEHELNKAITDLQVIFNLNISKTRMRQTQYMNQRQKMNFGNWGITSGKENGIYIHLKRIKHMTMLELVNKFLICLSRVHLWGIVYCMRKMSIWIYKRGLNK